MVFVQAVMVWRADKVDAAEWIEDGTLHGLRPPRLTMTPQLRQQVDEEIARLNGLLPQHRPEHQMSGNSDQ